MPELIWNGKEEAVKAAGKVPYRGVFQKQLFDV